MHTPLQLELKRQNARLYHAADNDNEGFWLAGHNLQAAPMRLWKAVSTAEFLMTRDSNRSSIHGCRYTPGFLPAYDRQPAYRLTQGCTPG
jgi:hypothetical protein